MDNKCVVSSVLFYGISEVSHGDAESEGNADPKT